MPLYRTSTSTWSSLTSAWTTYTGTWSDPGGSATGNISVSSNVVDIGELAWVWPETTVGALGIGNLGVTISYQTSTDNSSWSSASAGTLYGRYFKTDIEADADELLDVLTTYNQDITTKTYQELNSTTLTGTTAQRSLDVSNDFSKIFGVVVNASATEANIIIVDIANTSTANLAFTLRNVDTYGKVAVDGNVNITITGYPAVELDTAAGIVRRSDNAA